MRSRYRFGLLGHKIGYSKSSRIYAIIAEMRNVAVEFEVLDCAPENLSGVMGTTAELDGFSVTIPHKIAVMSFMDEMSESAQKIGAVNSVSVRDGRMRGFNTDAIGFAVPLRRMGFSGGRALVMGAGGAARAVVYALVMNFQTSDITVCGRAPGKAAGIAKDMTERLAAPKAIGSLACESPEPDAAYDLIVNCTPVGGPAMPDRSPIPDMFAFAGRPLCYDLVYDPGKTVFLRRAEEHGCRTVGGVSMLVRQAIESYTVWTGDQIDRDAVSAAVHGELRKEKRESDS